MIILVAVVVIVVALLIAGAVIGLALKLLWWALIGLAIGALARAVLPGRQQISIPATAGAGVAGSLLGGIVAHAFSLSSLVQFLVAIALAAAVIVFLEGRAHAAR
jgi:uncharacterized membrane protein YeaQ/YmgE (transglycosylase-associated protein family)